MSQASRFALNVTWTWPVMIALLFIAMLPLYGPIMPGIEGRLLPVTTPISFINVTQVDGGFAAQMKYIKLRDCEYLGASADNVMSGEPVEFHPYTGVQPLGTWATGQHISRPWFVGALSTDGLRIRWVHRCSPLWLTVTQAFP